MAGNVKILALVDQPTGLTPVDLLLPGETPLHGLTAAAMRALDVQHPHLRAKPIRALRYSPGDP